MNYKILAMLFSIAFFVSNVNANTLISSNSEEDSKYLVETYTVTRNEESEFLNGILKYKYIYTKKYEFIDKEKIGGTDTKTEEISKTKEYMNYSKYGELNMYNIPMSVYYNENGYDGNLDLDQSSISCNKVYDEEKGMYTYWITAIYKATLTKQIETEYTYKLKYMKVQDYITIPIVVGFILIGCIYKFRKNVKIYNLQYGKWVLIKKLRLKKKQIDINKIKYKEVTSKYKIELSKSLSRKLYNKDLKISKGEKVIIKRVENLKEKNIFEIDI